jgi:hypothetical protein
MLVLQYGRKPVSEGIITRSQVEATAE